MGGTNSTARRPKIKKALSAKAPILVGLHGIGIAAGGQFTRALVGAVVMASVALNVVLNVAVNMEVNMACDAEHDACVREEKDGGCGGQGGLKWLESRASSALFSVALRGLMRRIAPCVLPAVYFLFNFF